MTLDPARVAAVVPAYNEAGKIGDVVRKISRRHAACVIVVDDASGDGTAAEARAAGAERVVSHERNRGVGAAIRTGLLTAKREGFEFAVVLSGDDQHEPVELPRLLEPLFEGKADLVQGSRWLPGGAVPGIPRQRRWLTRLYPWLFRIASGYPSTDGTNGLRAFRLSLLDDARIRLDQEWLDRYELEPYLLFQAVRYGWRIVRPLVYLRLGLKR
jgi:dolichol-phosphate mannosyltransferase